jgi:hypothetical protein
MVGPTDEAEAIGVNAANKLKEKAGDAFFAAVLASCQ